MPAPCELPPVPGIPALERSDSANGEFNDTRIVSNSADRRLNRLGDHSVAAASPTSSKSVLDEGPPSQAGGGCR